MQQEYTIEWVRERVALLKENGHGRPRVHSSGPRPGNARVHPNGFIQLDLIPPDGDWHASYQKGHSGSTLRLHIWNPPDHELPHQGTVNEIHDHVFDMRSTVVKGVMRQRLYELTVGNQIQDPTHEMYRALYDKASSSRLEPISVKGRLREYSWFEIGETFNNPYTQPAFTFHDSEPVSGLVVTVMEKTKVHEGEASVLCPIGVPPDNSYDRQAAAPDEWLWEAIEASIA